MCQSCNRSPRVCMVAPPIGARQCPAPIKRPPKPQRWTFGIVSPCVAHNALCPYVMCSAGNAPRSSLSPLSNAFPSYGPHCPQCIRGRLRFFLGCWLRFCRHRYLWQYRRPQPAGQTNLRFGPCFLDRSRRKLREIAILMVEKYPDALSEKAQILVNSDDPQNYL